MSVLVRTFRNKGASQNHEISRLCVFQANDHGKNFMGANVCERPIGRSREARCLTCAHSRSNEWRWRSNRRLQRL